ncbi:uracil phosphoribosyltransferase [Erysipelotrichaceae bacterium]|nr:uracil phosphoribosyltransferase [Erysipelotrichaceae bacterium]
MEKQLKVLDHPLISHKLTIIRDKRTTSKEFAETVDEIAGLMAYEITRDVRTRKINVETPLMVSQQSTLDQDIIIVPILRAGLGMVEGIRGIAPNAKIGHIGMYRDEETLEPKEYFCKLPEGLEDAYILVVDPMLATGGSASATLTLLKARGAKKIKLVCLVGAPEGVKAVQEGHPDVDIYLAALDEKLNEDGYIVPGLGDAGDRLFGTK